MTEAQETHEISYEVKIFFYFIVLINIIFSILTFIQIRNESKRASRRRLSSSSNSQSRKHRGRYDGLLNSWFRRGVFTSTIFISLTFLAWIIEQDNIVFGFRFFFQNASNQIYGCLGIFLFYELWRSVALSIRLTKVDSQTAYRILYTFMGLSWFIESSISKLIQLAENRTGFAELFHTYYSVGVEIFIIVGVWSQFILLVIEVEKITGTNKTSSSPRSSSISKTTGPNVVELELSSSKNSKSGQTQTPKRSFIKALFNIQNNGMKKLRVYFIIATFVTLLFIVLDVLYIVNHDEDTKIYPSDTKPAAKLNDVDTLLGGLIAHLLLSVVYTVYSWAPLFYDEENYSVTNNSTSTR